MSGGGHSNRHGLLRLKDKNSTSSRSSIGEEMTQATMDELENAVKVLNNQYESTRKELSALQVCSFLLICCMCCMCCISFLSFNNYLTFYKLFLKKSLVQAYSLLIFSHSSPPQLIIFHL